MTKIEKDKLLVMLDRIEVGFNEYSEDLESDEKFWDALYKMERFIERRKTEG